MGRAGAAKGNEGEVENEQAVPMFGFVIGPPHILQNRTKKNKARLSLSLFFKETAYPGTAVSFSLSLLCVPSSPFPSLLSPSCLHNPLWTVLSFPCCSHYNSGTPGWLLGRWTGLEKVTWEIDWPGLPQGSK